MTSLASKQNTFIGKIKETNLPTKWIAPKKPPFREVCFNLKTIGKRFS